MIEGEGKVLHLTWLIWASYSVAVILCYDFAQTFEQFLTGCIVSTFALTCVFERVMRKMLR